MAKKIMMINATDSEEIRVATLVDGVLADYDVEFIHNEKIKGNIYKAKVVRVDTSLQAAFIHYGGQKNGFLPLAELPRDLSGDGRRGRIQDLLSRDQEIMVQAVREELGSKGAMMTGQISLAGRYLVITPGNPVNGISRKIEGTEERRHFKQLIDELDIPANIGVIVRTASLGVTKEDFQRDLEYLLDMHKEILQRYKHRQGPGLVWQEDDVVTRTLRDAFTADVEEVQIDDLETFQAAQMFFRRTMPQHLNVLQHYTGKKPLFTRFQVEEQIERIYGRKVPLPSGGALVLDQTEALVAIDVNSGKTSGDNQEDTAFRTNMEAAEEVAKQLRLRDLAGLVVIDFIDMKREGNIRAVQDKLVDCLRADKARMEVGKINRFGVLVMTRQRLRPSLEQVSHENCPTCLGTGKVKTLEAMVLSVVRRMHTVLSKGGVEEVRARIAPVIATAVLNQKRRDLALLEEQSGARIVITPDFTLSYGEMVTEIERMSEEEKAAAAPAAKPARERAHRDEETVVLGGDSPISFDKALGTDTRPAEPAAKKEFKYDRRDIQKAALDERERLRALFESVKPEDEEAAEAAEAEAAGEEGGKKEGGRRRRRRRGRGGNGEARAAEGAETRAEAKPEQEAKAEPKAAQPAPRPEPKAAAPAKAEQPAKPAAPEPPKLTGDLVASLISPAPRPKKLGAPSVPAAASAPAPAPAPAPAAEAKPAKKAPAKAKKAEPAEAPAAEAKPKKAAAKPKKAEAPAEAKPAKKAAAPKAEPAKGAAKAKKAEAAEAPAEPKPKAKKAPAKAKA